MRRLTTTFLSAAAVAALAAACGNGAEPTSADPSSAEPSSTEPSSTEPSSTEPSSSSPTTSSEPTGTPAFPQGTADQTAENSGEWDLVLVDVRVGEHEGYDRVVLEFSGSGTPGWAVGYVDEAVLDGSGEGVTLDGSAVLDIYASGTTYPADDGESYDGPRQFAPGDGGEVEDVHVGGTFEGYTQVLVGIDDDPAPFRVFALTGPPRLVVDVLDD
ncbi:hypothetical protein I601_0562 [Nocardioides dokdonensis FR1436]|uniref:AMIN-like domain-containing protein n=1 Tax=Nocardioides dokdonensis FR1436 TaxID=1300347 RepID=A0A1A9GFJ2_9ACTN|nr:hypothetical protein [Nocardioides dokdonensis]ANH37014.1 hypothetical protein I601_0562 [Nocardioides dokdonensis FR1436]